MIKEIEKIKAKGKTLAIIIRNGFGGQGVNFVSEPKNPFQIGIINQRAGHIIESHSHNRLSKENKENQEFIFVVKGEIEVTFYWQKEEIKKLIIKKGDSLLQMEGGHGFKILKPSKLIEVKQGPFYGTEKEKTYI